MLLQEYNDLEKFEILNESEGGEKTYRLRGVFSRSGVKNKNGRIYSREIMEAAVQSAQEAVKSGRFVGELDHPATPKVNIDKISHKITELKITPDGAVIGEMIPAGPEKYKFIALLEDKIGVGVSTRGIGNVKPSKEMGEEVLQVQPGYKMNAIDIVHDPSAGTYPEAVYEGYEYDEGSRIFAVSSNFKEVFDDVFSKRLK